MTVAVPVAAIAAVVGFVEAVAETVFLALAIVFVLAEHLTNDKQKRKNLLILFTFVLKRFFNLSYYQCLVFLFFMPSLSCALREGNEKLKPSNLVMCLAINSFAHKCRKGTPWKNSSRTDLKWTEQKRKTCHSLVHRVDKLL